MSGISWFGALALLASIASIDDPAERAPVPEGTAIEKAMEEFRALFKADYAKKTAADSRALAAKLLQLGTETRGNAAMRFALFRESAELAARSGGDPDLAIKAVTQLTAEFLVDPAAMKLDILEKAAVAAATNGVVHRAITVAALTSSDEAVKLDRYDEAQRLLALAAKSGSKAKDVALVKKTETRGAEVKEIAAAFGLAKPAEEKLKANPKDAEAARTIGRFRCLFKNEWSAGLALLADAAGGKLQELARKDIALPSTTKEKIDLADAYWDLASSEKGTSAVSLRRRAAYWYRMIVTDVGGLERERSVKRIEEADPNDLAGLLDLTNGTVVEDFVRIRLLSQITSLAELSGPIEVRVTARTKGNNIRLHGPKGSCIIFNWEGNNRELRVNRPDGVNGRLESGSIATAKVTPLTASTWYAIRWRMTTSQIDIWVDDKLIFTEKGKFDLSTKSPFRIGAMEDDVDVKSLSVKPVK